MTTGTIRDIDFPARHEASDRIRVMFARFIGAGFLFYLVLLVPSVVGESSRLAPWWTPAALAATFGTALAMGVASFLDSPRLLRITGGATAIGYLVAVATWPLAWIGPPYESEVGTWLSSFPGLASMAAAAAWRPALTFTHLVVSCVSVQILNQVVRTESFRSPLIPDVLFAIMFCTLFVAAAVMALRTGKVLDETITSTHKAAAIAAANHARTVERERFDALIHDGVMSTLLAAARQGTTPSVAAQSAATLRQLDHLASDGGAATDFAAATVLAHIRSAVTDVDETLTLETDAITDRAVPSDVTRAIAAAAAEAVRNSVRHAGDEAVRTVTVTLAADGVRVLVADNGVGFDPAAVPPHRLGLAVSIHGRMRQLTGASSVVTSHPGAGTEVRLEWRRR
ncbi:ATP-binding protein [Rhodococcus hoagii]|uniref:sensor histidine kinase n=1 Tax=Rhodococcus hoagii TaxID=43767 RepID=UPI001963F3AE|nr:ATP-binding protein [Prescottella equi]MBM9839223.1 ATP-binding protein [Prescottella equi]